MNERIRELAEQAGLVKILEEHAHEYGAGTFENTPYPELEKFAELIVKECAGLFPNVYVSLETEWGHTPVIAEDYIKKHFGIK